MSLPFEEEKYDAYVIRTFSQNISESELKWHYDNEDRLITIIGETDWKFQFDNELPKILKSEIFIKKGVYHRVIKGTGDLKVKIVKI